MQWLYCEDAAEKDGTTLVSQDTVFDMASVSKTFTAVCVLQLAEKGKLSIDDTLDKYFPAYETGKNITIYNLLHMSSGIPDYCNDPDPFWNISGEDAANQKLSDIYLDKISDEEFLQAISSYFAVRILFFLALISRYLKCISEFGKENDSNPHRVPRRSAVSSTYRHKDS